MKRIIPIILVFAMLFSGCGIFEERLKEPVTFYYLRTEYQFGSESSVIVSEEREASGHRDDLSYLMALYLMGPTEEDHVSPVPRGTRIVNTQIDNGEVTLTLSEPMTALEDAEFTLMCACLAMTCLGLTDADQVTIVCKDRSITMTRSNLMLLDNGFEITATEETQ